MKVHVSLLALAVVLFAGVVSVSQAQQRMRMTAEQRAARLKDSLSLSDDQVGKIITIFQDSDRLRQDAFASAGDDRDARMAAMRKLMDEADARIDSVLTDTQKAKYEAMKKERGQNFQRRPRND